MNSITTQSPMEEGYDRGDGLIGNVASISRVEEGSEKYDEKKNSFRAPDYLSFRCC
jgi:hypothetical protein